MYFQGLHLGQDLGTRIHLLGGYRFSCTLENGNKSGMLPSRDQNDGWIFIVIHERLNRREYQ